MNTDKLMELVEKMRERARMQPDHMADMRDEVHYWADELAAALRAEQVVGTARQSEGMVPCQWDQQDHGSDWISTGCGNEFVLTDASDYDDGAQVFKHCPYCAATAIFSKWKTDSEAMLAAAPGGEGEVAKDWRDAQTYDDLYACGIRGFLDIDNRDKPEAEVVAAVKEAMEALERGDYEEVAFLGDDLPPMPAEPYYAEGDYCANVAPENLYNEAQMRKFARDTLNRYAKHFRATQPERDGRGNG